MQESKKSALKRERKMSKKTSYWLTIFSTLLVVIAAMGLIALVLSQIFRVDEQHVKTPVEEVTTYWVECEAKAPQDAFFTAPASATENDHELKIIYKDGQAEKISYEYDSEYENNNAAIDAEAELHARYNNFMGVLQDDFAPRFSRDADELKITMVADTEEIGRDTAKVFFINTEEFDSLKDYDLEKLLEIYQSKGFKCEYGN